MSNCINRVIVGGNLGADPEVRMTPSGVAVLKLRLATNEAHYDANNRLIERTDWHDVALFGARAEGLARVLHKGDRIVVEGALRTSMYERDGRKIKRVEVLARDVMLNGRRRGGEAATATPPPPMPFEEPYVDDDSAAAEVATTGELVTSEASA